MLVITEHDIFERTDAHGDIASLLVLGGDWAGLDLSIHVHVATVAEQDLFVTVAEMALDA